MKKSLILLILGVLHVFCGFTQETQPARPHARSAQQNLSALENEYASGRMNKKRALVYFIALQDGSRKNEQKAIRVGRQLLSSLSERERLHHYYYPLYEHQQVVPFPSVSFTYFLDHIEHFRSTIGKERVDQHLTERYQALLDRYLEGEIPADERSDKQLKEITRQIVEYNLPDPTRLLMQAEFITSIRNKDYNTALSLVEQHLPRMKNDTEIEHYTQFLPLLDSSDKSIMSRAARTSQQAADKVRDQRLREAFLQAAANFEKAAYPGVLWEDCSLEEALQLAAEQQKLVFVDCYADWCAPCVIMEEEVYPNEQVGDFFNQHLINIRVNMEGREGRILVQRFNIKAYPTLLLLRPDGSVQHKIIGSEDSLSIIQRVEMGMEESTSTGFLNQQFHAGNRDKDFLLRYVQSLIQLLEYEQAQVAVRELFQRLTPAEKLQEKYWFIFNRPELSGAGTENFRYLLANKKAFDQARGSWVADRTVYELIMETLIPIVEEWDEAAPLEDLLRAEKALNASTLTAKRELQAGIALAKSILTDEMSQLLRVCQREFQYLSEPTIDKIGISILYYLKENVFLSLDKQYREVVNVLIGQVSDPDYKEAIREFAFE